MNRTLEHNKVNYVIEKAMMMFILRTNYLIRNKDKIKYILYLDIHKSV